MLWKWCDLSRPWVHMSAYFDRHRDAYMRGLMRVSTDGDWSGWIALCLRGLRWSCADTCRRITALIELRREWADRATGLRGGVAALLDHLLAHPIVDVASAAKVLGMSYNGARSNLEKLAVAGIVHELKGEKPLRFEAAEVIRVVHSARFEPDDPATGV